MTEKLLIQSEDKTDILSTNMIW